MQNQYTEEERYFKAKKRVQEIKGFYGNLVSFMVVNCVLIVINIVTSPQYLWFFWPLSWWGIGVLFHGLKVFNYVPMFTKDWEQRKIKEYMDREQETKSNWE